MQNLLDDLKELLQQDERLVVDGKLLKNKIIELALQLDPGLIKMLLTHQSIKKHFFQDVEGVMVFDKIKFQKFVSNKAFLPDSYTSFKNRIGLMDDDEFIKENKNVVLAWPYKDCVLEGGQTKEQQKRKEIFWNTTLAPDEIDRLLEPKALTNAQYFDENGVKPVEQFNRNKNGTITDNLIIKGNNLLALHSLKEEFAGKIKLIYIDPPFNTGNDSFQYNDSFNHSTWLTFMKNRLSVAKELLREDGVLFIHLDDIEAAYTRVMADEIFGIDNFINVIAVKSSTPSGTKTAHKDKTIIKQKDLILVYRKSSQTKFNPQFKRKDKWDTHFNYYLDKKKKTVKSLIDVLIEKNILSEGSSIKDFDIDNKTHRSFYLENAHLICQTQSHKNQSIKNKSRELKDKVLFVNENTENETMFYNGRQLTPLSNSINKVIFNGKISEDFSMLLCDFWDDIDFQNTQHEGGVSFPTAKKPELLLSRIIEMCTNENDIVLDFFLGSGTTAAVALKSNRQFIGIEQLDYGENDSIKRLKNVIDGEQSGVSKAYDWKGGGSFVYAELKKLNSDIVELVEKANNDKTLVKAFDLIQRKGFVSYKVNVSDIDIKSNSFNELSFEDKQRFLIEILDKNQLYLNFSEIEDEDYQVSQQDKNLNHAFYKS